MEGHLLGLTGIDLLLILTIDDVLPAEDFDIHSILPLEGPQVLIDVCDSVRVHELIIDVDS